MLEPITLENSNVSAEMDAYIHHALYGYEGVINFGNKLAYEIVSNNLIRIKDGLMLMQGRYTRITPGSYEEISIENGTAGVTRKDLIVLHFETDGISESMDIRVIKGDAGGNEPSCQTSDTFNGGLIYEIPLYLVTVNGISLESVTQKFTLLPTANDMHKGQGFYIEDTATILTLGSYKEWVEAGMPEFPEPQEVKQ